MPATRKSSRPDAGQLPHVSALWAEAAPKRPALTRQLIVREALALLDEVGFDALTIRRLAERLGVQGASLYKHVRDKDELLALLADTIAGEVRPMSSADAQSWRAQMDAFAWDYRRVLLAHRDAARVMAATPPLGPRRLQTIEQWLALLSAAGFSKTDIADVGWLFNTFVIGFVLDEEMLVGRGGDGPALSADEMRGQVRQFFKSLPAARFPTLVSLVDEMANTNMDRRFELGVQLLLDGLERRLAGHPSPKSTPVSEPARARTPGAGSARRRK